MDGERLRMIAIGIVAVPRRFEQFAYPLQQALLRDGGARVTLCVDDGCGYWENERRAWAECLADPGVRYAVVLEEDVRVCKDFALAAAEAIASRGEAAVTFHLSRNQKAQWATLQRGSHWMKVNFTTGTQAIGMSRGVAQRWLDWAWSPATVLRPDSYGGLDLSGKRIVHPDWVQLQFFKECNIPFWGAVPSLVNHVGQESSVLGHTWSNWKERGINVTKIFIGENMSGLGVDWSA